MPWRRSTTRPCCWRLNWEQLARLGGISGDVDDLRRLETIQETCKTSEDLGQFRTLAKLRETWDNSGDLQNFRRLGTIQKSWGKVKRLGTSATETWLLGRCDARNVQMASTPWGKRACSRYDLPSLASKRAVGGTAADRLRVWRSSAASWSFVAALGAAVKLLHGR